MSSMSFALHLKNPAPELVSDLSIQPDDGIQYFSHLIFRVYLLALLLLSTSVEILFFFDSGSVSI